MKMLAETIDAWPLAARMAGAIGSSSNIWQVVVGRPEREVEAADALVVPVMSPEELLDVLIRRLRNSRDDDKPRS